MARSGGGETIVLKAHGRKPGKWTCARTYVYVCVCVCLWCHFLLEKLHGQESSLSNRATKTPSALTAKWKGNLPEGLLSKSVHLYAHIDFHIISPMNRIKRDKDLHSPLSKWITVLRLLTQCDRGPCLHGTVLCCSCFCLDDAISGLADRQHGPRGSKGGPKALQAGHPSFRPLIRPPPVGKWLAQTPLAWESARETATRVEN